MAFALLTGAMLVAIAFGLYVAQSTETPSSTGEVSQSPYVYLIFILLLFVMGFLLSKVLSGENSRFSFSAFINVAFAALLVSGIAHEFVHTLLINHPVQMRFHFGDSKAIFSTCCLSPGEAPHEGIAYAVQFCILILWMFYSRHTFYSGRFRELWKTTFMKSENTPKGKTPTLSAKKSISKKQSSDLDEDDIEREWNEHKSAMVDHLSRKTKPGKRETTLEDDIQNMGKLKV